MTTARPDGLPDYTDPPLNEVLIGIQFADLPFKNVHAGLVWEKFRDQYPKVEEQPPLAAVFETFGAPNLAPDLRLLPPDLLGLQWSLAPDVLRYWFVSADDTHLLQVQRDRLILNWRKLRAEDTYPRYEPLKKRFTDNLAVVQEVFRAEGLGDIRPNQCEVAYINIIGPNEATQMPPRDLVDIFTMWNETYSDSYLSHIERGQFSAAFLIPGPDGKEPEGRLHIEAKQVIRRSDSAPAVRYALTARGRPQTETLEGALEWLDRGRQAVVKCFTSTTTRKMHQVWGRIAS